MSDVIGGFDGIAADDDERNANEGKADCCSSCGTLMRKHSKERVHHDDGTYSYDYHCP